MDYVSKIPTNDIPPLVCYSPTSKLKTPISSLCESLVDSEVIQDNRKFAIPTQKSEAHLKNKHGRNCYVLPSTIIRKKLIQKSQLDKIKTSKGKSDKFAKSTNKSTIFTPRNNNKNSKSSRKKQVSPTNLTTKQTNVSQFAIQLMKQTLTHQQNQQKKQIRKYKDEKSISQIVSLIFSSKQRLLTQLTHLQHLILKYNDQDILANLELLSCLLIKTLVETNEGKQQKPKVTIRQNEIAINFGSLNKRRQNQLKINELQRKNQAKKDEFFNIYSSYGEIVANLATTIQNLSIKKHKSEPKQQSNLGSSALKPLRKRTFGNTQSLTESKSSGDFFITHFS